MFKMLLKNSETQKKIKTYEFYEKISPVNFFLIPAHQ